jgi:NADH-quinone oxidoreductase subunit J
MNGWSLLADEGTGRWQQFTAAVQTPAGRAVAAALLVGLGLWLMLPRAARHGGPLDWLAPLWPWRRTAAANGSPATRAGRRSLLSRLGHLLVCLATPFCGGALLAIGGVALLASLLPQLPPGEAWLVFWPLAGLTLGSAAATVSMQNPVYAAVWFAATLLGTAGLFFVQGAQFLGVATVVVYAGAILVTFLFVLMLAQPEGHAFYDRLSWGWFPSLGAAMTGASLVSFIVHAVSTAGISADPRAAATAPVAHLGRELFTTHLVAVEVAGTLLLAALVGAVAIVAHNRQGAERSPGDAGPSGGMPPADDLEGADGHE